MRSQCISRWRRTSSLPTTGMLFSAWQAMTQAEQPVQALRSMTMPQRVAGFRHGRRATDPPPLPRRRPAWRPLCSRRKVGQSGS